MTVHRSDGGRLRQRNFREHQDHAGTHTPLGPWPRAPLLTLPLSPGCRSATSASRPVCKPPPQAPLPVSLTRNHLPVLLLLLPCLRRSPREVRSSFEPRRPPAAGFHLPRSVGRCRHKLASMPRWLSSKKVETVRALLAGVHAAFPVPSNAMLSACVRVPRAQRIRLCCARHPLPRLVP